jgi:hypothetical protein
VAIIVAACSFPVPLRIKRWRISVVGMTQNCCRWLSRSKLHAVVSNTITGVRLDRHQPKPYLPVGRLVGELRWYGGEFLSGFSLEDAEVARVADRSAIVSFMISPRASAIPSGAPPGS